VLLESVKIIKMSRRRRNCEELKDLRQTNYVGVGIRSRKEKGQIVKNG
jgi:hypothetical protein